MQFQTKHLKSSKSCKLMIVLLKLLPDNKHAIHSSLRSVTQNQHKLKIQLATPFLNWQNKVGLL